MACLVLSRHVLSCTSIHCFPRALYQWSITPQISSIFNTALACTPQSCLSEWYLHICSRPCRRSASRSREAGLESDHLELNNHPFRCPLLNARHHMRPMMHVILPIMRTPIISGRLTRCSGYHNSFNSAWLATILVLAVEYRTPPRSHQPANVRRPVSLLCKTQPSPVD